MNAELHNREHPLWRRFVEAENELISARMALFASCRPYLVDIVRDGLFTGDRVAALEVATLLDEGERQQLIGPLLALASLGNGLSGMVKRVLSSLSREWLIANIEPAAEPILSDGTADEFLYLLDLCQQIDSGLAMKLARRAAAHQDSAIRKLGTAYLEKSR
jgi:hypothetical protein